MHVIRPQEITSANLDSSDVPEDDYPFWDSGQPYTAGDRVIHGIEAWESLVDGPADDPPTGEAAAPPQWLRLGYINRWRMFRDGRDSVSSRDGGFSVEVSPDKIFDAVGLVGLVGTEVTVEVEAPGQGVFYSETRLISNPNVNTWHDWYFQEYKTNSDHVFMNIDPATGAIVTITVDQAGGANAECGRVVVGSGVELGRLLFDTGIRAISFTEKERDPFGNLRIIPRRTVRLVDYNIAVDRLRVDSVFRTLSSIDSLPVLFYGGDDYESTTVFGISRDFDLNIRNFAVSNLNLQAEGF